MSFHVILRQFAAAIRPKGRPDATKDALKQRIEQLVNAPRTEIAGWEIGLVEPGETTSWDGPRLVAILSALQGLPEYAPLCELIMACKQKGERKGYTRLGARAATERATGCNASAQAMGTVPHSVLQDDSPLTLNEYSDAMEAL